MLPSTLQTDVSADPHFQAAPFAWPVSARLHRHRNKYSELPKLRGHEPENRHAIRWDEIHQQRNSRVPSQRVCCFHRSFYLSCVQFPTCVKLTLSANQHSYVGRSEEHTS